jgi:hypothetical protein
MGQRKKMCSEYCCSKTLDYLATRLYRLLVVMISPLGHWRPSLEAETRNPMWACAKGLKVIRDGDV